MIPGRVIEYTSSSPDNCDLHVTIKIVYICILDHNTSYLIYARTCMVCDSVEIPLKENNYLCMLEEINKRKQINPKP